MDLAHKRWTLDEWDLMIRSGVLGEDDRVLLVEGEIFEMCPQNSPHSTAISLTQQALPVSSGTYVRAQLPLYLGASSDPEPDLAVVAGVPRDYAAEHPRAALLVIEVADSSLAFDTGRKARLYARHGIPEYWVVDLQGRQVHRFTQPHELGYEATDLVPESGSLTWAGQPVAVADLLP